MTKSVESNINIMLDIETLGTDMDSIITQIALVAFDSKSFEPVGELAVYPNVTEQIFNGRGYSLSTIEFWLEQDKDVLESVMYNKTTLRNDEVFVKISEFLINHVDPLESELYANGVLFDVNIVDNYFSENTHPTALSEYFGYNKILDYRTIKNLIKTYMPEDLMKAIQYKAAQRNPQEHNAIVDCYYQIDMLSKFHSAFA